jgi:serine phosphatase RsbU (regulator of sigma subunit)/tetratricopeptide (TPR) repeat protein
MKYYRFLFFFALNFVCAFNLFSQDIPDSLKSKIEGKSSKEQVSYLNKIANDNLKKSPAAAFSLAKIANAIAVKSGDKSSELNSCLMAGKAARLSGKSSEGIDYFNKAIVILTAANHKQGLATAYNELGLACKDAGKYNDAIAAFNKSASYYEELNDSKNAYMVYTNLGAVYVQSKQFKQALDVFTKVKSLAEKIGDKTEIASSINQLGVAYANYGNATEALNCFNKAKDIATSLHLTDLVTRIQTNIDNIQSNLTNKESSKTTYEQEQAQKQQEFVSSLQNENSVAKQQNLKSFEEIDKLSVENQAKEYRLRAIQGDYDKQVLENQAKEQNMKLLEAVNKQTKAEIDRKNESLAYQKKVLYIVGIALAIVLVLLLFIIRLYVRNKRTLKIVREQKAQIENQRDEIEVINKELYNQNTIIRESIDYAKHIQFALLPSVPLVQQSIPNFFVFFKPRDVVSGDFYWYYNDASVTIMATVDCTGHGVPGAFMSMIANSLLNNVVKENKVFDPAKVLEYLNNNVLETMAQSGDDFDNGMDITICAIHKNSNQFIVSMAGHACTIVQNNEIKEIDGKDFAIGGVFAKPNTQFENHSVPFVPGMTVYFYSDGYADQIGGKEGKKFGQKAFSELLKNASEQEVAKRSAFLETAFNDWKADKKQIDDILVMGFTI